MPFIANADEIKRRAGVNIAELIGNRIALHRARGGHWEGNCPWHNSASGRSLHVTPDKQAWYCWGCREGGSAIDFIMRYDSVDYPAALEIIAGECGVSVEYEATTDTRRDQQTQKQAPTRQELLTCLAQATEIYHSNLTAEARDYLHRRGITDAIIDRWHIGYSTGGRFEELPQDAAIAAGILKIGETSAYDPLAKRIIIPISDRTGKTVGFCGRAFGEIGQKAKYINTAETSIFKKGACLFGWAQSRPMVQRRESPLAIVEGQFKAIACIEAGIPAVAPGGTGFTPEQAAQILTLTHNVLWCPDPDEAGVAACIRGAKIARTAGLEVDVGTLVIPDSIDTAVKDPDDLMAMGLPVQYEATPLVEWLYYHTVGGNGQVHSVEDARRVADQVVPVIAEHPIPTVRIVEYRQLAKLSGIRESDLANPSPRSIQPYTQPEKQAPVAICDIALSPERLLFAAILQQGTHCNWQAAIPWIDLTGQQWAAIANIGHVINLAMTRNIPVSDAIGIAGKPELRQYYMYWLSIPEGAVANITALAAQVGDENRKNAAMKIIQAGGNIEYATYLHGGNTK